MKLLVVFTPLQYLNAIRIIAALDRSYLLLVLTTNKVNIDQIENLDINNKCIYPLKGLNFLHDEILWFVKLLYVWMFIKLDDFSDVVVGNFNNVVGYFMALRFNA